ncbi:hypothetical protein UFOVP810_27 [uncultured Caudovirales phage]|uniref:Uncharacterized protein n=1 Tax=uncultured Caudovirales phage TaxID=2100421 RepID=A0A6J5NXH6_9CAUD|nr:hypothetical protein UFOVP810_27 [uncultured Caudovirales phage]
MTQYTLTDLQKQRTAHCIKVMEQVRDHHADRFDMKEWMKHIYDDDNHVCGTAACFIGWLGLMEEDGWQNLHSMPSYPDTVGQSRYGSNAFTVYMQIDADTAALFAYEDGYPVFQEDDGCDGDVDYMERITPQMVIDKLNHFLQTGEVINHRPDTEVDGDDMTPDV